MYSTAMLVLARLVSQHAEQMKRIGMVGIDLQDLPIDLLGRLEPTGLVVFQGQRECFGNRCHRVYLATLGRSTVARASCALPALGDGLLKECFQFTYACRVLEQHPVGGQDLVADRFPISGVRA